MLRSFDQIRHAVTQPRTRRDVLKIFGLGLAAPAAASVLAACGAPSSQAAAPPAAHDMTAMPAASAPPVKDANAMDQMHEAGVKAFPAKTAAVGGQPLAPRMDGQVKVFDLVCKKVQWEVAPDSLVEAWTYNGQVPGPEIRVTEGDRVRVVVKNDLDESTAVHWHGLIVPNDQDGVPFITQPPITPGTTYTYEFTVRNSGSHMYHAHSNSTKQVGQGMLGAFIVEPKDKTQDPAYDRDYTMILNDQQGGLTLNGKSFPATQPLTAKVGEKIRVRYMNEGMMIHPMHLHGLPQLMFARDGWNLPQPYMCDTINVAPGERWDVIIDCTEPGVWAFHCHILSHAESEHGMFGMVTALIIEA